MPWTFLSSMAIFGGLDVSISLFKLPMSTARTVCLPYLNASHLLAYSGSLARNAPLISTLPVASAHWFQGARKSELSR